MCYSWRDILFCLKKNTDSNKKIYEIDIIKMLENFPFMRSNIPTEPVHGVDISQ